MKKISEFLKRLWANQRIRLIAIVLPCLALLFLAIRSLTTTEVLRKKLHVSEGRAEVLELALKQKEANYEELVETSEKKISELNGEIDSANTVLVRLTNENLGLEEKRQALEDSLAGGGSDYEKQSKVKDRIISTYRTEVFNLKSEIAEKDKIIFALSGKYESEHALRLECEKLGSSYLQSLNAKDDQIRALSRIVGRTERREKLKTAGSLTLLALLGVLYFAK